MESNKTHNTGYLKICLVFDKVCTMDSLLKLNMEYEKLKLEKLNEFVENCFLVVASWLQDIHPLNWPQVLWKCSNEGQELNVPLRNTQRYFLLLMAEAHCQNTHGIICTMSVPVPAEATGCHR